MTQKGAVNPGTTQPRKPAERTSSIAKGEPTKGSGSDTSPYSSARRGGKR